MDTTPLPKTFLDRLEKAKKNPAGRQKLDEKMGAGPSKGVDAKDIAARLQEIGESSKLDPAATPAATPAQKLPIRPAGDNGLSVQKTRAAPGATPGAPSGETRKVSATKADQRIASLGRTGPEATPRSLPGESRKVSATANPTAVPKANPTAVPKKDPKATAASGKNT